MTSEMQHAIVIVIASSPVAAAAAVAALHGLASMRGTGRVALLFAALFATLFVTEIAVDAAVIGGAISSTDFTAPQDRIRFARTIVWIFVVPALVFANLSIRPSAERPYGLLGLALVGAFMGLPKVLEAFDWYGKASVLEVLASLPFTSQWSTNLQVEATAWFLSSVVLAGCLLVIHSGGLGRRQPEQGFEVVGWISKRL
jgi:hypothetical protein